MEKLSVKSKYNKVLATQTRGNTVNWIPLSVFEPLLWIQQVCDNNYWPENYWIHHINLKRLSIQTVLEGELTVSHKGQTYVAGSGDGIIIPPDEVRLSAERPGGCRKRYVIFTGCNLPGLLHELRLNRPVVIPGFSSPEFETMFKQVYEICLRKNSGDDWKLSSLAYSILAYAASKNSNENLSDELRRCWNFIKNNIGNHISLRDMAAAAGCSESKLKWQFSKYFKTSPGRYLVETRLNYALRLMMDDSLSVKQIADLCGYENPFYFSNAFKARFGVSPREYRKKEFSFVP